MKSDAPLLVLWRRKWIVIGVFLAFAVTAGVVSKVLTKVYETSSSLLVSATCTGQSFDRVQASQALARSFGPLLQSPNIAQLVAHDLADGTSKDCMLSHTCFEPIAQ